LNGSSFPVSNHFHLYKKHRQASKNRERNRKIVNNARHLFSDFINKQQDEHKYALCVQSTRLYIAQYVLPSEVNSSYFFSKKNTEGTIVNLTIEMHPLRKQPTIKSIRLSEADKTVGILGLWHHGVEELFYAQDVQGQTLFRSLRHRNDDTIERGLSWLCTHILSWSEE
jgi:hypothetical protein